MELPLLDKLKVRDLVDKRFSHLFETVSLLSGDNEEDNEDQLRLKNSIKNLREHLTEKEEEIRQLHDVISVKNRDAERLNDELISINIENNLLQERLTHIQAEYDTLIERWLLKAQREADIMNTRLK
ncbi:Atg16p [Kluyveromyces lactis]|uniref:Autophagy protein 16 n=1 Tax=Kluyveromyces lactis (strain ATCC 8585 / CBS 2359 / DSM 70799 / NBRC 1267 / NRRL Y-1140 / WM37) TaxID=284590 RepID=ATG16_KLULA|nr:uncharacterized protein KLLA0_E01541g [Kluyveromyces lactis]Q6CPX2.1 RecName: Full=Autophagy protein 16 [Kluyveromyces lactis NRRL Y-1140]CAG99104.1 KLLA0E01541p [Kluyveromyces lactis]|eukprot:XP_454017.1 uncharacterized protein KLLA0_E01541g [Kluyveromyces lactis]